MRKQLFIAGFALCAFQLSFATDLLQVYQKAHQNAPILDSYYATNEAARDSFASTRGALLPSLTLIGSAGAGRYTTSTGGGDSYTAEVGKAQASQSIFNLNLWGLTLEANDQKDAAQSTYQGNLQSFMLTVSQNYFIILQDQDNLLSDKVADAFYKRTYDQTKQKFDAGLSTIKDVKQAETNYDIQRATTIKDKLQFHIDVSELARFTNIRYTQLAAPTDKFPYVSPKPNDENWWVQAAKKGNYTLQAANLTAEAGRKAVVAAVGSQMPELSVVGTYSVTHYDTNSTVLAALNSSQRTLHDWSVSLQATWSIFAGGANFANSIAAANTYDSQSQQALQTYRNVVTQTRQDFRTVVSDVENVHALKTAVKADKTALKQLGEKYKVGTATTVDVLDAAQQLFSEWRKMTQAQYKYINDKLTLRADTGSLELSDLQELNKWLGTQKPALPSAT